jgi:hypothetical protein
MKSIFAARRSVSYLYHASTRDFGTFTLEPRCTEVALSIHQAIALAVDSSVALFIYRTKQMVRSVMSNIDEGNIESALGARWLLSETLMARVLVVAPI